MNNAEQERRLAGPGMLAITMLFIVPSILASFAAFALAHAWQFPPSALWLVYEISWYLGILGAAIVTLLTINAAIGHRIPLVFVWLMGAAAVADVLLVSYASHIYRSPWSS